MDNHEVGVQFVSHKYDFIQNWTTQNPVPFDQNYLTKKLKKLDIGECFHKTTTVNLETTVHTQHILSTYLGIVSIVPLHCPISAQIGLVITHHVFRILLQF